MDEPAPTPTQWVDARTGAVVSNPGQVGIVRGDTVRADSDKGRAALDARAARLAPARAAKAEKRTEELISSTEPKDNAAKVKAILDGTMHSADLYRTITAGPSGQKAHVFVGRVRYTPDRQEGEFEVIDTSTGERAGWMSRTVRNGEQMYVLYAEDYDGGIRLVGWTDTVSYGTDVLVNGSSQASTRGTLDARRLSGGKFEAYVPKSLEQLDREMEQRDQAAAARRLELANSREQDAQGMTFSQRVAQREGDKVRDARSVAALETAPDNPKFTNFTQGGMELGKLTVAEAQLPDGVNDANVLRGLYGQILSRIDTVKRQGPASRKSKDQYYRPMTALLEEAAQFVHQHDGNAKVVAKLRALADLYRPEGDKPRPLRSRAATPALPTRLPEYRKQVDDALRAAIGKDTEAIQRDDPQFFGYPASDIDSFLRIYFNDKQPIAEVVADIKNALNPAPAPEPRPPMKAAVELQPGDRILYRDTPVTILEPARESTDQFGRTELRFKARREDTGKTGDVLFGPTGQAKLDTPRVKRDDGAMTTDAKLTPAMQDAWDQIRTADDPMIGASGVPFSTLRALEARGLIEIEMLPPTTRFGVLGSGEGLKGRTERSFRIRVNAEGASTGADQRITAAREYVQAGRHNAASVKYRLARAERAIANGDDPTAELDEIDKLIGFRPGETTIGVKTSSKGRTTTVTLPDGTTEQRTSKTKEYTHAVVVTTDNHGEAASLRADADRMEQAIAAAREIIASGDLTRFKRVPTSGSAAFGTNYDSRAPGFEDVAIQLTDYTDAYSKRAQADHLRRVAQGATFTGIDHTEYMFANSQARTLERADAQVARMRANADKLDAGPRYTYGVWRWSQSRTNAEKGRGEFERGRNRTTRVIGVGDDITGQTADESKPVKTKPTAEERKAAQAERAAAEKARVAASNEQWTARKVADIRRHVAEGNEAAARIDVGTTNDKGLRAIARAFGIKSTPRGMADYQKTEWLRNAILEAAKKS